MNFIKKRRIKCLLQAAAEAYKTKNKSLKSICGDKLRLIKDTDTLNFYINETYKVVVISIRGSMGKLDWKANVSTIVNNLESSSRYQKDKKDIDSFIIQRPPTTYSYYLSAHSLGGSIASQLVRDYKFIKTTRQFNPSATIRDLRDENSSVNNRMYIDKDPLYKIVGRFFKHASVLPYRQRQVNSFAGWLKRVASNSLPINIPAHSLNNFGKI